MIKARCGNKVIEIRNATWTEVFGVVAVLVVLAILLRALGR